MNCAKEEDELRVPLEETGCLSLYVAVRTHTGAEYVGRYPAFVKSLWEQFSHMHRKLSFCEGKGD